MRDEHHYRWRCNNPWGKRFTTSFHCTEAQIRIEHPEAEAVEGTLIVRRIPETEEEIDARHRQLSLSSVQANWKGESR